MSPFGDDHKMAILAPDRWAGIKRDDIAADVRRLSGSVKIGYILAELGARRL